MSESTARGWGDATSMRLQRYLARAGLDSRRHAEAYITAGRVSVNGEIVTTLGTKVRPGDEVRVDGEVMKLPERSVTLMLSKPRGVITAMEDPFGRPTIAELLPADVAGLFHVGRLDEDSSGLLLCTNDGALGHSLVHPRMHVPKRYVVALTGAPNAVALAALRQGIEIEGKRTLPAEVALISKAKAERLFGANASDARDRRARAWATVTLREGRTRQIRLMFSAVGATVVALHRFELGPLGLGDLKPGESRWLTEEEVEALREAVEPKAESC